MNKDILTPERPVPFYVIIALAIFGGLSLINDFGLLRLMNLPDMPLYARATGACGGVIGMMIRIRSLRLKKSEAIQ